VESQRGAFSMVRDGHCRSGKGTCGKGRYFRDGSLIMIVGSLFTGKFSGLDLGNP
jgi:hypothetical protein